VPSTLQIPADKPVRLVVDRPEANACSDQIVFPQLGVKADLAPNATTVVNLPATAAGNFTMTCGMGMMSGQLVVGAAGASGGSAAASPATGISPLAIALIVALGGAAAYGVAKTRKRPEPACPVPTSETATQATGILGLSATQVIIIGIAVVAAILVGLAAGGMLG
jgi:heme/copper-type cytochrome/quinol oxidase subunit 2